MVGIGTQCTTIIEQAAEDIDLSTDQIVNCCVNICKSPKVLASKWHLHGYKTC